MPFNSFGQAEALWTVDRTTSGATALFRVSADGFSARTTAPAQLVPAGHAYYVNDGSTIGDQYTTALGDNANSGKDAAHPMASLTALLNTYQLGAGDTVYVDSGNYTLTGNLVIGPQDSGSGDAAADRVRIQGPTAGAQAVFNRANTTDSAYGLDIAASFVTVDHVTLTGANLGVRVEDGASGVTLSNSVLHGNRSAGLFVADYASVTNLLLSGDSLYGNTDGILFNFAKITATLNDLDVHDNADDGIKSSQQGGANSAVTVNGGTYHANGSDGIYFNGNATIENLEAYGNGSDGLRIYSAATVSGVTVHNNGAYGIEFYGNFEGSSITGSTIYGQAKAGGAGVSLAYGGGTFAGNTVYGNAGDGVRATEFTARGNRVHGNGADGFNVGRDSILIGNSVYSNLIGIALNGGNQTIEDNLVYVNANQAVVVNGGSGQAILNNTLYQPVGQALVLQSGASNTRVENNIFYGTAGALFTVASDSETGLISGYNIFDPIGPQADVGSWGGTLAHTLAAWQLVSGQDRVITLANGKASGSRQGDPLFVDPDGADNVLGTLGTTQGNGLDDDFSLKAGSVGIDAGDGYVAPLTDYYGASRHDDPATIDSGVGYDKFVQSAPGASSVPANGTVLTGYNPVYTLPFAFSFYGKSYTSVTLSTNGGFLQFDPVTSGLNGNPTLADFTAHVRIAAFWSTFYSNTMSVVASASSVTFEWTGQLYPSQGAVAFAVTLKADGSIRFDYGAGNTGGSPLIGLSSGNPNFYTLANQNGAASLDKAPAILFTPTPGFTYADIGAVEFEGSSADQTPPKVVAVSGLPANGGTTLTTLSSLVATFTEALDPASAGSAANYTLLGAGTDGQFGTADDVNLVLAPSYSFGSKAVTLQAVGGSLADGLYRLTLSGTKAIYDTAGLALDGDGNGTPGGDYVRTFKVDTAASVPVAGADSYAATSGVALSVSVPTGVLANDTDPLSKSLSAILVTGPSHGTLALAADGSFTYTASATFAGIDSFIYRASDGNEQSAATKVSITVALPVPVNQAPTSADASVTTLENQAYTFKVSDFPFSDSANALQAIVVTAVPGSGTLTLGGVAVSANQVIAAAQIGTLVYTPAANAVAAASFGFEVRDNGGTSNGGQDTSTAHVMSIAVTPVNQAPASANASVTTLENQAYTFKVSDFPFSDTANTLQAVVVTALPGSGTLTLGGVAVSANQVIAAAQIGTLVYTPAVNAVATASFGFEVRDNGGTSNGGHDTSVAHVMSVAITPGTVQSDTLTLRVSGDSYKGPAQFLVLVDGVQVGGVQTATASHAAGQTQDIAVTGTFGSNPKAVTVKFINDLSGGTPATDRNLYVTSLTLDGTTYTATAAIPQPGSKMVDGVIELFANSSISFPLVQPAGPDTLTLKVSGDSYQGPAEFVVLVDGVQVQSVQAVTASHAAGQTQDITLTGTFGSNPKAVTVTFFNDLNGGTAGNDRNLYVTSLTLNGTTYAATAATLQPGSKVVDGVAELFANSSISFPLVQPAGPDTLTLKVAGDSYQGPAEFVVLVDGVQVGGVQTATASHAAGQTQDVTLTGTFGSDPKAVTVTFFNDLSGGTASTDRNLYVTSLTLDGTTYAATAATLQPGSKVVNGVAELFANSSITFPLAQPAGPDTLTLTVAGDSYQGPAEFVVLVDGVQVQGVQAVTASHAAGQTQDVTLTGTFGSNPKAATVTFFNDLSGGTASTDRNLYVTSLTLDGTTYAATAATLQPGSKVANGVAELFANSSITFPLAQPAGPDTLTLTVAGDSYQGPAEFVVAVDGVQVGGVQAVTASHAAGQTQDITLTGTFGSDPKAATVTFFNDLSGGTASTDRNLYVTSLTLDGTTYAATAATLQPGSKLVNGAAELFANSSITVPLAQPAVTPAVLTRKAVVAAPSTTDNTLVATPQSLTTIQGTPVAITLAAAGVAIPSGQATSTIVTVPQHGTLVQSSALVWVYTADASYAGSDAFGFSVSGTSGTTTYTSSVALVSLTVTRAKATPAVAARPPMSSASPAPTKTAAARHLHPMIDAGLAEAPVRRHLASPGVLGPAPTARTLADVLLTAAASADHRRTIMFESDLDQAVATTADAPGWLIYPVLEHTA